MVTLSIDFSRSVLIAALTVLGGCRWQNSGIDGDCPTWADEVASVAQGPVGRIDFPIDHPRRIQPAEIPDSERNSLNTYLANEPAPWRNVTVSTRTRDGLFIGLDNGEWGGKLLYVPSEKGLPNQPIILKNVTFAFESGDQIFVLTGLSHLDSSEGALWSVTPQKVPKVHEIIRFPAEVKTIISTPRRSLVFVTDHGRYRLQSRGQIGPCM